MIDPIEPSRSEITLGESFELELAVRNEGGVAEYGSISVSFPGLGEAGDASSVEIVESTMQHEEFEKGDPIYHRDGRQISATYLLAESYVENWQPNYTRYVKLRVTPEEPGTVYIYVRATLGSGTTDVWRSNPASSARLDQQGWPVYRLTVDVIGVPNEPPTISIVNGPPDGGTIASDDPGFVWEAEDADGSVVGYEVDLQGPSPRSFPTTSTYHLFSPLEDGPYTFRVRAQDDDGVWSAWAERSFTIDTGDRGSGGPLVAHYPFDGDADDASGNGHDGTVHGATLTEDRFKNARSAYSFDGVDDYVDLASAETLLGANPNAWSATYWFKTANINRTQTLLTDYLSLTDYDLRYGLHTTLQHGGIVQFHLRRGVKEAGDADNIVCLSKEKVEPDRWYHVSVVVSKGTGLLQLYMDGQHSCEAPIYTSIDYIEDVVIRVGKNIWLGNDQLFLEGFIDDVRIYDKALSAAEVLALCEEGGWDCEDGGVGPSGPLVAHYPLDGDASDASGNGRDGTVRGATLAEDRFGNANSAYRFDGAGDHITVPNDGAFDVQNFTLAAWMKPSDQGQNYAISLSKAGFGERPYNLSARPPQLGGDVAYFRARAGGPDGAVTMFGTTPVVEDEWQFVVSTYDGAHLRLYVDGRLENEEALSTALARSTTDLFIGRRAEDGGGPFDGLLDDIRIYDEALSAAEVLALCEEGGWDCSPPDPPGDGCETSCEIAGITFYADTFIEGEDGVYEAKGNVNAEETLYFTGDLVLDLNTLSVSGDGLVYVPHLPYVQGQLDLFEGEFEFSLTEEDGMTIKQEYIDRLNQYISITGFDVTIDRLAFVEGDLHLSASMRLPEALKQKAKADPDADYEPAEVRIDPLIIGLDGIKLGEGSILLQDLQLKDVVTINELLVCVCETEAETCACRPENPIGSCEREMLALLQDYAVGKRSELRRVLEGYDVEMKLDFTAPLLDGKSVGAGVSLQAGKLESFEADVDFGQTPLAIGSSGLAFGWLCGGINGLATEDPVVLTAKSDIVPVTPQLERLLKFQDVGLTYTFGDALTGEGSVFLFPTENGGLGNADAEFTVAKAYADFSGAFSLLDVLNGDIDTSISWPSSGVEVQGTITGSLVIPALNRGFPFDWMDARLGLPRTVAGTESYLTNTAVGGSVWVGSLAEVTYRFTRDGNRLEKEFGFNWRSQNERVAATSRLTLAPATSKAATNPLEGTRLLVGPSASSGGLRSSAGGGFEQDLLISENLTALVLRAEGAGVPAFSITLPDGRTVTPQTDEDHPDVEYVTSLSEPKAFYVVSSPEPGTWTLSFDQAGDYLVDVFGTPPAPDVSLGAAEPQGSSVDLRYTTNGVEGADIRFYYDTDNQGADGVAIELSGGIAAGKANVAGEHTATWDASDVPTGTYHVYAVARGEGGTTRVSYLPDPITIVAEGAPSAPSGVQASIADDQLKLTWSPSSGASYYLIHYETDGNPSYESPYFNVGDVSSFSFSTLTPGRTYRFAVAAVSEDDRASALSGVAEADYVSQTRNNAPSFEPQTFPSQLLMGASLSYAVQTTDPDGDPVTVRLTEGPEGLSVSAGGQLSWTPSGDQGSTYRVQLEATDGELTDEAEFVIDVMTEEESRGRLAFDQGTYAAPTAQARLSLWDANENRSPSAFDEITVRIASTLTGAEMTVKLRETHANSGRFEGGIALSQTGGGLLVESGDEVVATYEDALPAGTVQAVARFGTRGDEAVDCADAALRILALDADGDPDGEDVTLGNDDAEVSASLDGCSFVTFDPFTERVVFAKSLEGLSIPAAGTLNIPLSTDNSVIPDGPGAVAVVEGASVAVGTDVMALIDAAKAAWVYLNEDTVIGQKPDASKASGSLLELMRSLQEAVPDRFALLGNYPNPFNPQTTIRFELPERAHVRLAVFDIVGREVARLVDGPLEAGRHEVAFEASDLPSGTYLYRLEASPFADVGRMVLLK